MSSVRTALQASVEEGGAARPARSSDRLLGLGDLNEQLREFLYKTESATLQENFGKFEAQTGGKRENLVYGIFGLTALYLIVGASAQLVCNLICFAYPAYATAEALRTSALADHPHWLTYWGAFGLFSVLDFWANEIMDVLPLYWIVKAATLLYLMIRQTGASELLSSRLLGQSVTQATKSARKSGSNQTLGDANNNLSKRSRRGESARSAATGPTQQSISAPPAQPTLASNAAPAPAAQAAAAGGASGSSAYGHKPASPASPTPPPQKDFRFTKSAYLDVHLARDQQ